MKYKIAVVGLLGKMGLEIFDELQNRDNVLVTSCAISIKYSDLNNIKLKDYFKSNSINISDDAILTNDKVRVFQEADIVIDFSSPAGLQECLLLSEIYKKPLVSGVTPMDSNLFDKVIQASNSVKICWSANMSISVCILKEAVNLLAKSLNNYDCEIVETHHRNKKDSPSGTAILLGKEVSKARGLKFQDVSCFHRQEKRQSCDEIGFSSLRGGSVFGKHQVSFFGDLDSITIEHTAFSRKIFASGAIDTAIKLSEIKKNSGFFEISDLFTL
jgi:4-hydroxy-tetrahydrodipicolinate reductase